MTGEKNGQGELFDLSKRLLDDNRLLKTEGSVLLLVLLILSKLDSSLRNRVSVFQFGGKVTITMYNVAISADHVLLSQVPQFAFEFCLIKWHFRRVRQVLPRVWHEDKRRGQGTPITRSRKGPVTNMFAPGPKATCCQLVHVGWSFATLPGSWVTTGPFWYLPGTEK